MIPIDATKKMEYITWVGSKKANWIVFKTQLTPKTKSSNHFLDKKERESVFHEEQQEAYFHKSKIQKPNKE